MGAVSPTFHIQTFGCQMNAADSAWLARALAAKGFLETSFAEAGVHILNTCSVRDKPEQKVYSELGRIAYYCKANGKRDVLVCVGGCVAQQIGANLAKRFPQVRLIFGGDGIAEAPDAISRLADEPSLRITLLDFKKEYQERPALRPLAQPRSDRRQNARPCAFVNIMQGCDNFCSYCIVPFVRGRQKSRAPEAVISECAALTDQGAREITLLGQNVNAYGLDRGDGGGFSALLRKVSALPGLQRLRFVTSHPKDLAPGIIEQFGDNPKLCPRLHLPLQSGSDSILKAMNRRYDLARYIKLTDGLRRARPDIALTTDLIVGFPGETDDDFRATLRAVENIGFAAAFSFVYSDRPRTAAARMPEQVSRPEALERLAILQELQNKISEARLQSLCGTESLILVEGRSHMETLLSANAVQRAEGDKQPGATPGDEAPKPPSATDAGSDRSAGVRSMPAEGWESWHGRTPHGFIVNVMLEAKSRPSGEDWRGAVLPVRIEAAAKHSLKGAQAGPPCPA
ncbi:MAG: tRNA (N6-isopentenyl adenosine(37)-C2)-methylthiotransferase MiaB [Desulfovibrio sp.]|jgi:tRNA-2-methylthio-N6-dimethylallyladenosine synthase|nr:tRNA (N6-isopentenyl adenosine(37)-C2)-methylthiotransferase MiaB [Desulfovibrio sp.]